MQPTIPIATLSPDSCRRIRELLAQEDLTCLEGLTANDIDKVLLAYRDALVTMVLERVGRGLEEFGERLVNRGVPCPVCGECMTLNRDEDHDFETSVGVLGLCRAYMECRPHKVRFYPLDAHLKLPAIGRAMPLWANALSQLGVELPYEPGRRVLKALTQRNVSGKTIDAQVQRDGRTLHAIELEEAKKLWPYDEKGYARIVDPAVIQAVVKGAISRAPTTGRALVLQADGAMINLAADEEIKKERKKTPKKRRLKGGQTASEEESDPDQKQEGSPFRESIQLLIYRLDDVVRKRGGRYGKRKKKAGQYRRDRTIISQKQTACAVNDPVLVALQMNRLALLWGHLNYCVRIFVADGGPKLWELAKEYYQFTVGILDINHARSHIHDCGKALYRADVKKARAWGQSWAKRILKEGAGPLLAHLKKLTEQSWDEEQGRLLKNLVAYVETHQEHMNYPEFVAKRYPIASGAIEGANKHILISRCRRSGQQFKKANAQHLLTLRTALVDNRWDEAMEQVRERQAYPKNPTSPQGLAPAIETRVGTGPAKGALKIPSSPSLPAKPATERQVPPTETSLDRIIPWRKQVQLRMAGLGHLIDGPRTKGGEAPRP